MQEIKPVSQIKINDEILITYRDINRNNKEYVLNNGIVIQKISDILTVKVLDDNSNVWNDFNVRSKKWKNYIYKKYISRSTSMKGKNNWSKGRIPPNKGMSNKEFFGNQKAIEISKKLSRKSKNYFSDPYYEISRRNRNEKISDSLKGRKITWSTYDRTGIPHSEETKILISQKIKQNYIDDPSLKDKVRHVGKQNHMYGKHHSEETRKKISETLKKRYSNDLNLKEMLRLNGAKSMLSQNRKRPKTELEVQKFLYSKGIEFQDNYIIKYYEYDFFVPQYNILIEVQGDYWHANPEIYSEKKLLLHQKEKRIRDIQKRTFAENMGFQLIEIWEKDIKNGNFDVLGELC